MDNWSDLSTYCCNTCRFFVPKPDSFIKNKAYEIEHNCMSATTPIKLSEPTKQIGRCRKHAPTLNGWPVVYSTDWCGDHKIGETP